ncbi:MAG: hypothetical protein ACO1TE_14430 [Prosthecobacter sp.]
MNLASTTPFPFTIQETSQTFNLPHLEQPRDTAKLLHREEFRIGAYRMRGGRLAEVLIGQKGKRGLRYVGAARPAVPRLRDKLFQMLRMLRVHTFCPFVGLFGRSPRHETPLPEDKVAECQWVEANVKVWVEFEGWSESGHLVNPRVIDLN